MTIQRQPTRAGVRDAAAKLARVVPPTPLYTAEIRGRTVFMKAESLQPMGAFKLRGAWHRLTALDEDQRRRGVVAFSSGNHAQGVAWAAKRLGIAATIVMPADAPRAKREGTLALGACGWALSGVGSHFFIERYSYVTPQVDLVRWQECFDDGFQTCSIRIAPPPRRLTLPDG